MSSAANAVRSLIFVAIFKILNVKKMLKNVKFFTHYFSCPPWLLYPLQRGSNIVRQLLNLTLLS